MNTVLCKFFSIASRNVCPTGITNVIKSARFSVNNSFDETSEEAMTALLKEKFPDAKIIKVQDVSGGCGAMYNIYVETKDFKGLSVMKQHRSIYDTLKEQIKHIHGLQIETKVPP